MNSDDRITLFADVLLPVPVPGTFTYRVPLDFQENIRPLQRVIVPFGPRKIITGLIVRIHQTPPVVHEVRMLLDILDGEPLFNIRQLELMEWMAGYYMCSAGDVLNAAMPAGLKLSSESLVQLHPGFDITEPAVPLTEKEQEILKHLQQKTLSYPELSKIAGVKNLHSILKSLRQKEAVIILEEIRQKFQPKREKRIRFTTEFLDPKQLELLFSELAAKPKQEELLLEILRELPVLQNKAANEAGVAQSSVLDRGHSASSLKTLIKSGVLEVFDRIVSRFEDETPGTAPLPILSPTQQAAERAIMDAFSQSKPALLFGVTGSGKTEVYISLIQKALDGGGQVLFLLPEIALTTQIVTRLRKVFGGTLGVYHSRFSDNERVEVWNHVAAGRFKVIVGVRSSVFLPFENLGLVIVDEEHDSSYKQDRAPRYQARDTALMLGRIHHARILLGSGTPSAESFYHVQRGTFQMAVLNERFGNSVMPDVKLVDLTQERKAKRMRGSFSQTMIEAMEKVLAEGDQIILFQNRRGYAPALECQDCGNIPQCLHCSVSLTYHQYRNALICHYCGYRERVPKECTSCRSTNLSGQGPGTEKIEEEAQLYFPQVTIRRMDLDTTRSKSGYEEILSAFAEGKTNILVGTQMVTKGLDFDKVGLVGVFDCDRLMYFPDFRSHERTFQVLVQVSGRAGRREKKGTVVIQTHQPRHPLFAHLTEHQVKAFMDTQLADRHQHQYPPYTRLIAVSFRHSDKAMSQQGATEFCRQASRALSGITLLGPSEPPVSRIRNEYVHQAVLKIPRQSGNLPEIKERLMRIATIVTSDRKLSRLRIVFDVDPWNM